MVGICLFKYVRIVINQSIQDVLSIFGWPTPNNRPCVDQAITMFSDHCQISTLFRLVNVDHYQEQEHVNLLPLFSLPLKWTWDKLSVFNYQDRLASDELQRNITDFINTDIGTDREHIKIATKQFNDIIDKASSGIFNRQKQRRRRSTGKKQKWFDKSCEMAKRDLMATAKLINKSPYDSTLKIHYYLKNLLNLRKDSLCKIIWIS